MKRRITPSQKEIGSRTDATPSFCSIRSALKAPCCTILESISDGVFTIDPNKRVTSFNRAAELITGFKNSEAIGQYCFDVFRANICERNAPWTRPSPPGDLNMDVYGRLLVPFKPLGQRG